MFKLHKRGLFSTVFVIIVFSILITLIYKDRTEQTPKIIYKTKEKVVYKTKLIKPKDVLLTITKTTLLDDIRHYKGISNSNKALILTSIYKYAKKYTINPLIVYAVIATESSFRFWINHSLVNITIDKHKIKTRGIGLGAIIWEWWSKDLKANNIATVKSDLYNISNNIEAVCYILKHNMDMLLIKGTTTKQESAFIRYFGGGTKNSWYATKVNKVLSNLMKKELYK